MSGKQEKLRRKMLRQMLKEEWDNTMDLKNHINSLPNKERWILAWHIIRRRF